jgi:hypothetical protein
VFPFQVVLALIPIVVVFALTSRNERSRHLVAPQKREYLLESFSTPRFDMYPIRSAAIVDQP